MEEPVELRKHVANKKELCEKSTTNKVIGQMRHEIPQNLQAEANMKIYIQNISQAKT